MSEEDIACLLCVRMPGLLRRSVREMNSTPCVGKDAGRGIRDRGCDGVWATHRTQAPRRRGTRFAGRLTGPLHWLLTTSKRSLL